MDGLERFDHFLITIVNETGGVEGLLHAMFGFLFRRTDFFYEMLPGEKMGFLPGDAERMVLSCFKAYQKEYFKSHPPKDPKEVQRKLEEAKRRQEADKKLREEKAANNTQTTVQTPGPAPSQQPGPQALAAGPSRPQLQPKQSEAKKPPSVDPKFKDISTYNGGRTERYAWSQSITDVLVQIDLDRPTKSKDLDVSIENKRISARRRADGTVLIEGEFYDEVKVEDSTWSIEEGEKLILNLEKGCENIWKTVIKGDAEIDGSKVENTKKLDDFDEETQGALRKIVYEQNRKAQGLPTTEEEQQMEMLRKAWDAEGSPFKGTPFDPSKLGFGGNGQLPPLGPGN